MRAKMKCSSSQFKILLIESGELSLIKWLVALIFKSDIVSRPLGAIYYLGEFYQETSYRNELLFSAQAVYDYATSITT